MKTAPQKPPRRPPGVIRDGAVYTLAEVRSRLGVAEAGVRQARTNGLRLITFGRQKFALGSDVLKFFEALAEKQGRGEQ